MGADRWQYLALMAACLAVTAPLEPLGAGVYRRAGRLARTLLPVVAVFAVWDVVAIARGHWSYNARYTTGLSLPGHVPVEELVFFVVIPLCAILTYEVVSAQTAPRPLEPVLPGGRSAA
ncbi:MAG TPA: lycopene cyclase domain-containing protein [Pseudonocardiaceae bacterium]|jgi:lycopene cyclase domain-containing protein|nr:lycopene cyclase domain-containing protein [Pseudonocardiaceae bacterium]